MPFQNFAVGHSHEVTEVGALKAAFAEFIGTFLFVFAGVSGCEAITKLAPGDLTVAGLVAIALVHGVALFVSVAATASISGGHVNPAVTFGLVVGGQITVFKGLLYWVAQLIGAALASGLLILIAPVAVPVVGLGASESLIGALIYEIVGTFALVFVVYATAVHNKDAIAPIAIGFTVLAFIFAAGPFSGAAFNPARAFGPALATFTWTNHWVYWVGDLIGGLLAGVIYTGIFHTTPTHAQLPSADY